MQQQSHPVMPKHSGQMEDHTYLNGPTITCELHTPLPELQHPVADSILENDADSLLYTGIPLTEHS